MCYSLKIIHSIFQVVTLYQKRTFAHGFIGFVLCAAPDVCVFQMHHLMHILYDIYQVYGMFVIFVTLCRLLRQAIPL